MSMTTRTPLSSEILEGITAPTLKKLADAGIVTLENLAVTPPRVITEITGMGKETAEKYTRQAGQLLGGYRRASEYNAAEMGKPKISTGVKDLDDILKGGIATGEITELISEWSGGKTQLCFTLSVMVQQPPFNAEALVIDTENTFNTGRIHQIATARGLDADRILGGIMIAKAYNSAHEELLVKAIPEQINRNPKIKLVIVDSIIGHFRQEYVGRGTLADRQGHLGTILSMLLRVAQAYDVAVVTTNQMISVPDANPFTHAPQSKPAGGFIVGHAGTQRLSIRRAKDNMRIVKIIDSSNLPPNEARFLITEAGAVDVGGEDVPEKEADEK